jgi:hypothetical protein
MFSLPSLYDPTIAKDPKKTPITVSLLDQLQGLQQKQLPIKSWCTFDHIQASHNDEVLYVA